MLRFWIITVETDLANGTAIHVVENHVYTNKQDALDAFKALDNEPSKVYELVECVSNKTILRSGQL